jgi:O-acetyl-ADP-ribose deacetylase (regulator of RNase III)
MKDVFEGTPDKCIIVQQCNAKGVMGAGLAKAIRDRYPQVYDHYRAEFELGLLELGYTSYIEVEENILICNIVGQESYGREKKLYTNYKALRAGLEDVKMMAHDLGLDVVIPFGIGCGLGGGKWSEVVYPMIEYVFKGDLIEHVFQGGDV